VKAIDSVLKILVRQGGTELRLASDRPPQMFKDDVALPLTIPAMSTEGIRTLLDDLWTTHAATLHQRGELSLTYTSAELGRFALLLLQPDPAILEVRFRHAPAGDTSGPPVHATHESMPPVITPTGRLSHDSAAATLPAALAVLLTRAVSQGASDLHLSPQQPPIVRINGVLHALEGPSGFDVTTLLADPAASARVHAGRSLDRAFDVPSVGRVRVNIYASDEGLCAAVRLLRREAPRLAGLHLPPQIESLTELPHGLIIACGPTGCGKSTTLAALAQHALGTHPQLLITLEDPIEYVIGAPRGPGLVRQREVGTHVTDFAAGLRDALREDPDLILIGEMRDPETISLALTAAETGHLVLASLHTRTAPSAVERIIDVYAPERQRQIRVQLADSLRAVISQRLLPTADGTSRVPAVELLRVTHGVANLIREGRTAQIVNALQAGGNDGMVPLERSLTDLVRGNRIQRETAMAAANDRATLAEYLRATGA